jgi:hypothetical protein
MRPVYRWLAGLCFALAAPGLAGALAPEGKEGRQADKPGCGSHGTAIDFVDTPREAAARAKKAEKLVFILHVSGHFEDPRFT